MRIYIKKYKLDWVLRGKQISYTIIFNMTKN
jgi:hypothetical protein